MAVLVLTNVKALVGAADLTGYSNKVTLAAKVDALDATTFASDGWRTMAAGLREVTSEIAGFWEAGSAVHPDDRLFADLGVAAVPQTVIPQGATVGNIAYFTRVLRPQYQLGGTVGELAPFMSTAVGDGTPLVRGQLADSGTRTSTATTTALTLAVPSAAQRVYCALHVHSVSGTAPSLTATLQTDDAAGFPTPATVATGSAITAAGSQWLAGAAGVGEGFYRLSLVIAGTAPSFTVTAVIGVA